MQLSSKHQDEPNHLAAGWHYAAAQHSGALATDAHENHSAPNVLPVAELMYHMLSTATTFWAPPRHHRAAGPPQGLATWAALRPLPPAQTPELRASASPSHPQPHTHTLECAWGHLASRCLKGQVDVLPAPAPLVAKQSTTPGSSCTRPAARCALPTCRHGC